MMVQPRHGLSARRGAAISVALALIGGCKAERREVLVFAASSLARSFADLEEPFERAHPDLDLRLELGGSQELCRGVAELHRPADVVATADYRVIDEILRPKHADFTIRFATDEIVLAHGEHSRYTEEVTADNWPMILLRPEVRLGMVAPDLAPIGYRTLLVWQLAEQTLGRPELSGLAGRLRARCAKEHVAPHEDELLQLLQARAIDYAFVYRSNAEDHNLKTVILPEAYNLGSVDRSAAYARAEVKVQMKSGEAPRTIRGAPAVFGLTIPREARNQAGGVAFVRFLLGEPGQRPLRRSGLRPLSPAACAERRALPAPLQPLTR
jgi:molybdate/tungstate transport system substrate-binding protein